MNNDADLSEVTVSYAELVDALKHVSSYGLDCAAIASCLMHYALDHREPEYIPGEIYQDAKGRRLIRADNEPWPWKVISHGSAIDPSDISYMDGWALEDYPERPLRRLVPEPGPDE